MPCLTLIICLHNQRDFLKRLLESAQGCYDQLLVIHDGIDSMQIGSLVEANCGCFIERPRENQQEPHWPFAWAQARYDWILRLDADEVIGPEMRQWLVQFRKANEPVEKISGYECFWPIWNGRKTISERWPAGRNFLFHRNRVRFFGMAEQSPVADGCWEKVDVTLYHRPARRTHGLRNVLVRRQAYIWRKLIAKRLLGKPTDLPCWRWDNPEWPANWERIRLRPLKTGWSVLLLEYLRSVRGQWRADRRIYPIAALNGPINHALICFDYWRLRRRGKRLRHTSFSPLG